MATIRSGNGTDPWSMMGAWIKAQQTERNNQANRDTRLQLQEMRSQDAAARTAATNDPANVYAKTDARLKARIANGFGPKTAADMTGNKAAQAFRQGLTEGGITNPYGVALLMGNAQYESGGSFNPKAIGDRNLGPGREAHGMLQWREERFDRLQKYAASKGASWDDPRIQGQYAAWELTNLPQYKQYGEGLNNLKDTASGQPLMRGYLGYSTKPEHNGGGEGARIAGADIWFKKGTGLKEGTLATTRSDRNAPQGKYIRDPDHPYLYRDPDNPDAPPFQINHMSSDRAKQLVLDGRKKYKKDADRLVEQITPDKEAMKNGYYAYKIYSEPPPIKAQPTTPAAPVPQAAAPAVTGMAATGELAGNTEDDELTQQDMQDEEEEAKPVPYYEDDEDD